MCMFQYDQYAVSSNRPNATDGRRQGKTDAVHSGVAHQQREDRPVRQAGLHSVPPRSHCRTIGHSSRLFSL